jgi:hypothetical protein
MILKSQVPWKKITAEFIAITAAVYLGLLADNYREHRLDMVKESEYLTLLARDLDSDLETLQYTSEGITSLARAADLIHRAAGGGVSNVSDLEKAFSQLFLTWTYEQQRPTYLALRDGLGLHIISDHDLRSVITNYYEVDQSRLQQDYMTNFNFAQRRLRNRLGKYVRFLPPGDFESLSAIPDNFHVVRLHSPVSTIGDDIEFMNDLGEVGGRAFELAGEIDRVRAANRIVHARLTNANR